MRESAVVAEVDAYRAYEVREEQEYPEAFYRQQLRMESEQR
jgi:hypothetical protein